MRIAWFLFASASAVSAADPALTIYNQNFAVVRDSVALELKPGVNRVQYQGVTLYLEPDSVTLRDPAGKVSLRILEQSYRADPISMAALLTRYEGQTIDFLSRGPETTSIVRGKIVRAGSAGQPVFHNPHAPPGTLPAQAIVEVDGKLRFDLPGIPLFPSLSSGSILKPTLDWTLHANTSAKLPAELSYITAGLSWDAAYNIVQPEDEPLELTGWVTMVNRSGRAFENARIKLMAGDLNKVLRPELLMRAGAGIGGGVMGGIAGGGPPPVTEKSFDEYHLYSLPLPATLHDGESKQVEFLRTAKLQSKVVYVYDGMKVDHQRMRMMPAEAIRMDSSFGSQSTNKVWVMREFENSKDNGLGVPLPKGRTRFYRRDSDGQVEFTGEDNIDHTPTGETVRIFTGAAFDLVGERKRTSHRIDHARATIEESFEIKVRNHKKEAAEVRIVEHLYRWSSWDVPVSSVAFTKRDSDTIEFTLQLQPGEEKSLSYSVRYTW